MSATAAAHMSATTETRSTSSGKPALDATAGNSSEGSSAFPWPGCWSVRVASGRTTESAARWTTVCPAATVSAECPVAARKGCAAAIASVEVCVAVIERVAVKGIGAATIEKATVIPVNSPAVPSPAKSEKRADAESDAERNVGSSDSPPWIKPRPQADGIAIHQGRIVFGHVYDIRSGGSDVDIAALIAHRLLRRASQIACLLRFLPHELDRAHHVGLLVVIRVAEFRSP